MSDQDKQDGTGQVKKRSLSSYLLNVSARKAELENLAKHEKDGPISASIGDRNEAANAGGIDDSPNQQGSGGQQASEERPAMPAINAEELEGGTSQELLARGDKNAKAVSEDVSVAAGALETQKPARWQECGGENGTVEKEQDDPREPHGTVMHAEGTAPGGAASVASDAVDDERAQQRSEVLDAVGPWVESQRIDSVTTAGWAKNDEQESSLSEIDSDAPTEPASPPKPRLGRLVRGDQLGSAPSNAKWHTRPAAATHDSDSELSDLADLKPVPLSSSILHGESSPTKAQSAVSSSPKKALPHPAHSTYSKSNSSSSKKMKHVAVSKIVKPRKGVYRDAGGRTRLQVACDKGKYDLARKLIEEGYDVNDQDNAGNSPLHEAALNGHLEVVKLLIRHGANVNIQSYEMFKDTPLIDASANGHLDVVRELLQNGADPTIVNAKGLTAIESIEDDSDLDEEEVQIVREIKALLRKSARKHKKEDGDVKSLPQRSKAKEGHSEEDESVQGSAAFDKDFYWTDITSKLGKEKLFRASKEGRLAYVGAYLENGGHADFRSFMESVKFGHEDIASLFLAFGAQVNAVGRDGQTALMAAVGRGHLNTVKLLLEAGADPTKRDKDGHSVLYYARHSPLGLVDDKELTKLRDAILENNGVLSEEDKLCLDKDHGKTTPLNVKLEEQEALTQIKSSSNVKEKLPEKPESPLHSTKANPTKERIGSSPTYHLSPKSEKTREQTPMRAHISEHEVVTDDEKGDYSSVKVKKRRIGSPSAAAASDDRSYRPATSEKARTASPHKLKRSVSAVSISSDTAESGTKRSKLEGLSSTHSQQQETPEERDARLKREEQYKLKRLESKRKKEQEFLQKLADDERKREEEKERAEQERRRQQEEERLRKTQQEQLLRDQQEIEKRIAIRDQYPLGLKLVDFQNHTDYNRYLPVPYIVREGARYLLDLHAAVLCKNPEISRGATRAVPVAPENLPQLWNIYKFLFLYGGYGPGHYLVDFSHLSLEEQLQLEHQEYLRFVRIPLHWLPYDDIPWPSSELRTAVDASMRELQLLAPPHVAPAPLDLSRTPQSVPSAPTPAKFRHRPAIAVWLSGVTSLW